MLTDLFKSKVGIIFISILLGFGLGALFRKVCKGDECMVIKAPNLDEIRGKVFKQDDDCYRYDVVATACEKADGAAK